MAIPKPDTVLDKIAVVAHANAGRSKLARWMRIKHDEFAAIVEATRPNWQALAEAFAEEGMTAPDGKPLSAETVRVTWWRVRQTVEKVRARKTTLPIVERPVPASDAVRQVPVQAAADPLEARRAVARLKQEAAERSGRKT